MITPASFEDKRTLQSRVGILRGVVVACLALLIVGYWVLQVLEYQKYSEAAENNQLRTIPLRAPRGVLYDRHGTVLVENTSSFTIAIVREHSPNPKNLSEAIRVLAIATKTDEAAIADIVQRHRREATFRPIPVIEHATFEQVAAVMARKLELPEVVVQEVPTRSYPKGGVAAHLFGYVSEIQERQLQQVEYAGLQSGALVGQSGLERSYNSELIGEDGARRVAVNSRGREISDLGIVEPVEGARLQLTLDYDMQLALESAFKAQKFAGSAVFMDPNNGEILALTSQPEYDPNDFAQGLDPAVWRKLNDDPLNPLTNRLLGGTYSPGSTFKILMATAALAEGVITPDTKFMCPGGANFYGRYFRCHKKEGHGAMDVRHAMEKSCNVFFYNVADRMKIDTIYKYAQMLGLVGKTGIDLPFEKDSLVPSTEWKMREARRLRRPESEGKWYPGETISVGIGQGAVSVTPISLATMMASIANGGTRVVPHVAKAIDTGDGRGWQRLDKPAPKGLFQLPSEVIAPVLDGLSLVVNGAGTASSARIAGFEVAGKTGTAQVIGEEAKAKIGKTTLDLRDNAWFVFFAPREKPEVAGVVLVDHGGHGGVSSAPIAKFVLETYLAKKQKRPLPVWKPAPGMETPDDGADPPPPVPALSSTALAPRASSPSPQ
jgi:penicillin-binding protein 2